MFRMTVGGRREILGRAGKRVLSSASGNVCLVITSRNGGERGGEAAGIRAKSGEDRKGVVSTRG